MAERGRMPTSRAGTSNNRGFTFIEISMVLLILAVFTVAAFPRFTAFLSTGGIENSISRLSLYIEHLRDQAIYRRKALLLHCDIEKGRFWVTAERDEEKGEVLMRPFGFPEDVKVMDIVIADGEKIAKGEVDILFFPGGKADGALIHLKGRDERDVTLEIPYLARDVKVHEGYVEII